MKVKKHGDVFEKEEVGEEFKCESCGCEFAAKEGEFYVDSSANNLTISYTVTTNDIFVCSCPECHKICKKYKERKEYENIKVIGT